MADTIQDMFEFQELDLQGKYEYVVRGAEVSCKYGSTSCVLNLLNDHGTYASDGRPLITVTDSKSENIKGFGICNKNRGKPCKCNPELNDWFITENMKLTIVNPRTGMGNTAVTQDSTTVCKKGGIISFKTSGQATPSYKNEKMKDAVEIVEDEKQNWRRKDDRKEFKGHVKVKHSGLYNFGIEFYDIKIDNIPELLFVYESSGGRAKYVGTYEIKNHDGKKEKKFSEGTFKISDDEAEYVPDSYYWNYWVDIILYAGKNYYFEVDCPGRDAFNYKLIGNQEIVTEKNIMMAVWKESDICTDWYKKNIGGITLKESIVYLHKPYIKLFYDYLAGIYLNHAIENKDTAMSTGKTIGETIIGIMDTATGVFITAVDTLAGLVGISEIEELAAQLNPYVNGDKKNVNMVKIVMYGNPEGLVKKYDMDAEVSTEVYEYNMLDRVEGEKYHWGKFTGVYYGKANEDVAVNAVNEFIENKIIEKLNN